MCVPFKHESSDDCKAIPETVGVIQRTDYVEMDFMKAPDGLNVLVYRLTEIFRDGQTIRYLDA